MTVKSCHNCAFGNEDCLRTRGVCDHYDRWEYATIPSSMEDCEIRYPKVDDIPEGTCEKCGRNKIGGDCGHTPKKREAVIITHSRFYSPQGDEMIEQIVPFPVLMEE